MSDLRWGESVARELAKRGKTQAWLAAKVGVEPPAICRYVAGARVPRGDIAARIQRVLGVKVALLERAA